MTIQDLLAVIWLLVAIVASLVVAMMARERARRKRRRPWIWFTLGLLVGIFALFALARLPVVRDKDEMSPPSGPGGTAMTHGRIKA